MTNQPQFSCGFFHNISLLTGSKNSQNSPVVSSEEYFSCPEDSEENENCGRCSPHLQDCAIVSKSDYQWTTFSEILDLPSDTKRRIKGFVKHLNPDLTKDVDPLEMLCGLCTDGCCSATQVPILSTEISSLMPCKECGQLSEIIFNLGIEISETEISNSASTVLTKWMFCSGLHAEKLLGCSAQDFYESQEVRDEVIGKWVGLNNKPVQLSAQIVTLEDGSKEFHIIDSAIVRN